MLDYKVYIFCNIVSVGQMPILLHPFNGFFSRTTWVSLSGFK